MHDVALREAIAQAIYDVSNRWIAPNFGGGWKAPPLAADERTHRLHLEFADAVLAGPVSAAEARAQAAQVPPGWKLVPIEPTPEMKSALAGAVDGNWDIGHYAWEQAMAASPAPPEPPALDVADRTEGVCHDEQMTVWSGEIVGSLAMGDYLRDGLSYEDTIHIHALVSAELRSIIKAAFAAQSADLSSQGKKP